MEFDEIKTRELIRRIEEKLLEEITIFKHLIDNLSNEYYAIVKEDSHLFKIALDQRIEILEVLENIWNEEFLNLFFSSYEKTIPLDNNKNIDHDFFLNLISLQYSSIDDITISLEIVRTLIDEIHKINLRIDSLLTPRLRTLLFDNSTMQSSYQHQQLSLKEEPNAKKLRVRLTLA